MNNNITNYEKSIFDKPIIHSGERDMRSNIDDLFETEDQPIRYVEKDYLAKEFYPVDTSANLVSIYSIRNIEVKLWRNEYGKLTIDIAMDTTQGRAYAQWSSKNGAVAIFGKNELKKKYSSRAKWFSRVRNEFREWRDSIEIMCKHHPEAMADNISTNIPGVKGDLDRSRQLKMTAFYANKINMKFKVNDVNKYISIDRAGLALAVVNSNYYVVNLRVQDQEFEFWFQKSNKSGKGSSKQIGIYNE